jgi:hypothetical protein
MECFGIINGVIILLREREQGYLVEVIDSGERFLCQSLVEVLDRIILMNRIFYTG